MSSNAIFLIGQVLSFLEFSKVLKSPSEFLGSSKTSENVRPWKSRIFRKSHISKSFERFSKGFQKYFSEILSLSELRFLHRFPRILENLWKSYKACKICMKSCMDPKTWVLANIRVLAEWVLDSVLQSFGRFLKFLRI